MQARLTTLEQGMGSGADVKTPSSNMLPWILVGVLAGVLVGVVLTTITFAVAIRKRLNNMA